MIITREYIYRHKTDKGAWTRVQIMALGVSWPPSKGWINSVIGCELDEAGQEAFESQALAKPNRAIAISDQLITSAPTRALINLRDRLDREIAGRYYAKDSY